MGLIKQYVLSVLLPVLAIAGYVPGAKSTENGLSLPATQVQVTLSPAARKTLMAGHEQIVVSANWYGWPTSQWQLKADEAGQIDLGEAHTFLPPSGGRARLLAGMITAEQLGWLKEGVYINVNVYSGRRHWVDNILACDFIDGTLADVGRNPVELHCSLISERAPTHAVGQ